MILAIRTDKPEAEIYLYDSNKKVDEVIWLAHRELSATILKKIEDLLKNNSIENSDISGVVVFRGPGSYTGLRIGVTVANAYAYSLKAPVVGAGGESWVVDGVTALEDAEIGEFVVPEYGGSANITTPRK